MPERQALVAEETSSPVGTVVLFYGMVALALLVSSLLQGKWPSIDLIPPAVLAITLHRGSQIARWLVILGGGLALLGLTVAALMGLFSGLGGFGFRLGGWEVTDPTALQFIAFWLGCVVLFCLPAWLLMGPRARLDLSRRAGSESVIWAD